MSDSTRGFLVLASALLVVILIFAIMFFVITCPNCGTHFPGMGKFCVKCGYQLPSSACPVCGSRNTADFCGSCGASIPNS